MQIVLAVYFLGMLGVLRQVVSMISWIDEKVSDADSHRYFWGLWSSGSRWMGVWSLVCSFVYMFGIERPSQPIDYLIGVVFAVFYAIFSGAAFVFLPAMGAAMSCDDGEAAMIKMSGGVFLLQWAVVGVIFYFIAR